MELPLPPPSTGIENITQLEITGIGNLKLGESKTMTHEKIIKREDGTQYKITCVLDIDPYIYGNIWDIYAAFRGKRKRKWLDIPSSVSNHEFKCMSYLEKKAQRMSDILKVVTPEEIHEAKLELWEKMKPIKP